MRIHTVFITHDRLELTKRAIESYLETVSIPFTYVVVDNASSDGTREWLRRNHPNFLLPHNRYPGYACNLGWCQAKKGVIFLHRADNDFVFLPGWCEEVLDRFNEDPRLGQLGLRTDEEELHAEWNVGGNCVIRKELFDDGLRYDARPWTEFPPGFTEDSFFSPAVIEMGYRWDRVERPCIASISQENPEDPYYRKTWADRRIHGHEEPEA